MECWGQCGKKVQEVGRIGPGFRSGDGGDGDTLHKVSDGVGR